MFSNALKKCCLSGKGLNIKNSENNYFSLTHITRGFIFLFSLSARPTLLIHVWPVCWHCRFISQSPFHFILTFCREFAPRPACQGQLVDCIKHWITVGISCICDGFCAIGPARKLLKKPKSTKSHTSTVKQMRTWWMDFQKEAWNCRSGESSTGM